jgi:hypothetical protein
MRVGFIFPDVKTRSSLIGTIDNQFGKRGKVCSE